MKLKILIVSFVLTGFFSTNAQQKKWSLQDCLDYAMAHNITIKQSELALESAKLDKLDAIGSILPTINAAAGNSWNTGLAVDPITNTNRTQTFRSSNYGASAGITLFRGLRNHRQLQRAKINRLLSQYNLGKSKDDIKLFVANNYLQVLLNKESLKVIDKQHAVTMAQLDRTKELVKAGVLPENDLLDIEATSADELTRIVQAQNAILIARIGLAQALLIKDYENFDIEDQEYMMPSSRILNRSVEEIISVARNERYEVQIAEQNELLARKDLQIARSAYYPTLSGSISVNTFESGADRFTQIADPLNPSTPITIGVVGATGQEVIGEQPNFIAQQLDPIPFLDQIDDNFGLSYGVSLNIPILNGMSARNAVKRSKINLKSATYQLTQAKLDLDANVYQAYVDAKGAAETYEAARVAVNAQERAYVYAKDRYDVGMMNAFDFSQSKFRLENAESNVVRAKFDYIFKLKVLELFFGIDIARETP